MRTYSRLFPPAFNSGFIVSFTSRLFKFDLVFSILDTYIYCGRVAHVRTSVFDDDTVYIDDNMPINGAELLCELYIVACNVALDTALV